MPNVKINDIQLYYEIHGLGHPLLLISGLGCDSQDWPDTVTELSKHFQVIIFDNRAAGRNQIPNTSFTISDMASDTVKLLDFLNIRSAHIIGHSMGGYIAQDIAINHPEYVNKLILESTAPVSSVRNNLLFKKFLKWRKEGMDLESWIWAWLFWLLSPKRFSDMKFINTYIKAGLEYPFIQSAEGFKYQLEAIFTFDVRNNLKDIKAEALIIEGKEDILILPYEAEALKNGIPNASILYVEDTAHRIHMENLEKFNQAVLNFLKP